MRQILLLHIIGSGPCQPKNLGPVNAEVGIKMAGLAGLHLHDNDSVAIHGEYIYLHIAHTQVAVNNGITLGGKKVEHKLFATASDCFSTHGFTLTASSRWPNRQCRHLRTSQYCL